MPIYGPTRGQTMRENTQGLGNAISDAGGKIQRGLEFRENKRQYNEQLSEQQRQFNVGQQWAQIKANVTNNYGGNFATWAMQEPDLAQNYLGNIYGRGKAEQIYENVRGGNLTPDAINRLSQDMIARGEMAIQNVAQAEGISPQEEEAKLLQQASYGPRRDKATGPYMDSGGSGGGGDSTSQPAKTEAPIGQREGFRQREGEVVDPYTYTEDPNFLGKAAGAVGNVLGLNSELQGRNSILGENKPGGRLKSQLADQYRSYGRNDAEGGIREGTSLEGSGESDLSPEQKAGLLEEYRSRVENYKDKSTLKEPGAAEDIMLKVMQRENPDADLSFLADTRDVNSNRAQPVGRTERDTSEPMGRAEAMQVQNKYDEYVRAAKQASPYMSDEDAKVQAYRMLERDFPNANLRRYTPQSIARNRRTGQQGPPTTAPTQQEEMRQIRGQTPALARRGGEVSEPVQGQQEQSTEWRRVSGPSEYDSQQMDRFYSREGASGAMLSGGRSAFEGTGAGEQVARETGLMDFINRDLFDTEGNTSLDNKEEKKLSRAVDKTMKWGITEARKEARKRDKIPMGVENFIVDRMNARQPEDSIRPEDNPLAAALYQDPDIAATQADIAKARREAAQLELDIQDQLLKQEEFGLKLKEFQWDKFQDSLANRETAADMTWEVIGPQFQKMTEASKGDPEEWANKFNKMINTEGPAKNFYDNYVKFISAHTGVPPEEAKGVAKVGIFKKIFGGENPEASYLNLPTQVQGTAPAERDYSAESKAIAEELGLNY